MITTLDIFVIGRLAFPANFRSGRCQIRSRVGSDGVRQSPSTACFLGPSARKLSLQQTAPIAKREEQRRGGAAKVLNFDGTASMPGALVTFWRAPFGTVSFG